METCTATQMRDATVEGASVNMVTWVMGLLFAKKLKKVRREEQARFPLKCSIESEVHLTAISK